MRSTPPSLAVLGAHVVKAELLKQPKRRMKVHPGLHRNIVSVSWCSNHIAPPT